ncbi:ankyrin repeat domain-containing protein [Noviherbaspirillum pedocola]|uniref:Ankyrin repeat domain-containing protein n=1 Tax=Noviherbaspirillum pedocola TaxID=2801341 RepID=A0A934SUZ5_9BURK|nr:ankyrin repeat domain-containing protein [Noviherbaspirillum pedocola]MBK4737070.1 ankyrin repeat domain-containing protein [Noviherbaspirillum pedocola]
MHNSTSLSSTTPGTSAGLPVAPGGATSTPATPVALQPAPQPGLGAHASHGASDADAYHAVPGDEAGAAAMSPLAAPDRSRAQASGSLVFHGPAHATLSSAPTFTLAPYGAAAQNALFKAVRLGRADVVETLLAAANIHGSGRMGPVCGPLGSSLLVMAASLGHEAIVRMLYRAGATAIHSALKEASSRGHKGVIEALITMHGVNTLDDWGLTVLIYALILQDDTLIRTVLSMPGLDVNARNSRGLTALVVAVNNRYDAGIQALLAVPGIDVNARGENDMTVLMIAAQRGYASLVPHLLAKSGIDVNATASDGSTALHYAVVNRHESIALALLDMRGIDILAEDGEDDAAPYLATRYGLDAVERKIFVMLGEGVAAQGAAPVPALVLAAARMDEAAVRGLLAHGGASINAKTEFGVTALHLAASAGNEAIFRLLMQRQDLDINAIDTAEGSALVRALKNGHAAIARALLAMPGIKVNVMSLFGTALMLAAKHGYEDIVEQLLAMPDIDVNATSEADARWSGDTALDLAVRNGHEAIVLALLRMPRIAVRTDGVRFGKVVVTAALSKHMHIVRMLLARPECAHHFCSGALKPLFEYAAQHGRTELLRELLATPGVDAACLNLSLYLAVEYEHPATVLALLEVPGIDVNFQREVLVNGGFLVAKTALLHAAAHGLEDILQMLLAMPAIELGTTTVHGQTALELALSVHRSGAGRVLIAMPGYRQEAQSQFGYVFPAASESAEANSLLQSLFASHDGQALAPGASSSVAAAISSEEARRWDTLCDKLCFGKCTPADVPALLSSTDRLPDGLRSRIAMALAFGTLAGHYLDAAGQPDPAIGRAIDKAGLGAALTDATGRLRSAAQRINLFHVDGMNLLGIAAKAGNERMICGLVRMGAYVNLPSPNGRTALAIAVENRQWGACAELVFHGALPTLPLHDGYPALYHIVRDFNADAHASASLALLIRYLRKKGVRFDILVKNPDESSRNARPAVPLYELLVSNAQSWTRYGHILFDLKDAALPDGPAPASTAAVPATAIGDS